MGLFDEFRHRAEVEHKPGHHADEQHHHRAQAQYEDQHQKLMAFRAVRGPSLKAFQNAGHVYPWLPMIPSTANMIGAGLNLARTNAYLEG